MRTQNSLELGCSYIDRVGVARFKGRLSRFNPSDPQYDVETFDAGMGVPGAAQIRGWTPFRGRSRLINAYQAIPKGCPDHRLPDVTFIDEDFDHSTRPARRLRGWAADGHRLPGHPEPNQASKSAPSSPSTT